MGIFDRFFSKEAREEGFVKKHVKRILSKYSQKELREESMYALAERGKKGSAEAIYGLLQRFTYNHPEAIVDENEKHKVLVLLNHLGAEACSEPLRRYLRDQKQAEVAMALIALEQLEGDDATRKEIIVLLEEGDPGDAWSAERKLQIINHLDNFNESDVVDALIPYLTDLNDDVIFRTIDLLEKVGEDEQIRDAIFDVAKDPDTSTRIIARILDLVREKKWYIGDHREAIEANMPEGYFFDKRNNIKKR